MLPTRKRTALLKRSIDSLLSTVSSIQNIELLVIIDDDDQESDAYVNGPLLEELKQKGVFARFFKVTRLGYNNLHQYYNHLAINSMGKWLLLWNDDATMSNKDWDLEIMKYTGQFKLLRFKENHLDHPNALFPCVPRDWVMLFDKLSDVVEIDSWISQICYLNDIVQNLESEIFHDRHDITNNNYDEVVQDKMASYEELDENNPERMIHPSKVDLKLQWAAKVNWYLKQTGQGNDWFDKFILDKDFDAWSKFKEADKNNQCFIK